MQKQFNEWFEIFLNEKEIPYSLFEIKHNNNTHLIDNDAIINLIKSSSPDEQLKIKEILVEIDFKNGDINHFFKHLAKGYVSNYS